MNSKTSNGVKPVAIQKKTFEALKAAFHYKSPMQAPKVVKIVVSTGVGAKLVHIVLPRVKDFRGLKSDAIDEMGNMTLGFKEHVVFPETSDEDSKDIFGLAITIVTTAKSKKEAEAFLRYLGLPLRA